MTEAKTCEQMGELDGDQCIASVENVERLRKRPARGPRRHQFKTSRSSCFELASLPAECGERGLAYCPGQYAPWICDQGGEASQK